MKLKGPTIILAPIILLVISTSGVRCSGMWWNLGFLATKFTPNTLHLGLGQVGPSTGASKRNLPEGANSQGYRLMGNGIEDVNVLSYPSNLTFEISSAATSIISPSSIDDMNAIATWCNLPGLSAGQRKLCVLYHDHMYGVGKGAAYGIHECQYQFRAQRWNCSVRRDDESVFGPILKIPSRETAFAHAINSAGVVHAISRFCRQGVLASCGCPKTLKKPAKSSDGQWKLNGCGDNLKYGYRFATEFIDIREREKFREKRAPFDKLTKGRKSEFGANRSVNAEPNVNNLNRNRNKFAKSMMNLHNNEAGRRAVHHTSQMNCKCHGVSGSCSVKTCWLQLGPFRKIGHLLKSKYDDATRVKLNRHNKLQVAVATNPNSDQIQNPKDKRTSSRRSVDGAGFKVPTALDLVYLKRSPDFCRFDPAVGFAGTSGRVCSVRFDPSGSQSRADQRYADIRDFGNFGDPLGSRVIRDDAGPTFDYSQDGPPSPDSTLTRNLISIRGGDVTDLMTFYLFTSSLTGDVTSRRQENEACGELCCGRGYARRTLVLQLRCDCKFQWCCHVRCSLCERNVTLFVCR